MKSGGDLTPHSLAEDLLPSVAVCVQTTPLLRFDPEVNGLWYYKEEAIVLLLLDRIRTTANERDEFPCPSSVSHIPVPLATA